MNLSPASTASSSDLYPNSEPADQDARAHPKILSFQGTDRPLHSSLKGSELDSRDSAVSDANDKYASPGLPKIPIASSSGAHPVETLQGRLIRKSFKRKRGDDVEPSLVILEPSSANSDGNSACPTRTASTDSARHTPSIIDAQVALANWSSKKRAKGNDTVSRLTSRRGDQFRWPHLPDEIWQHIFSFVPPVFLGRLLRVNHVFHAYLSSEGNKEQVSNQSLHGTLKLLSPETIWTASRRRFCPGLPKPIRGLQELDMWRLLRGHRCQVCGEKKASGLTSNSENPWESGPGETGVRVIWPWGVRSCGKCIQRCSEKEADLLFSSDSSLLPALTFAFISPSNHYVTCTNLRNATTPPTLQLAKHYYKPHLKEIRQRLADAKELGKPSAEEWFKGLEFEGKDRLNEVIRWEQWEARGGLKKVNPRPHLKAPATPGSGITEKNLNNTKNETQLQSQGVRASTTRNAESGSPASSTSLHPPYLPYPFSTSLQSPWITPAPHSETLQPRLQTQSQQVRPERNIHDVNEAKANRRAEIERRCAALNPPLLPSTLVHMESFQAAIQISQPLTDHAWNVLKPRLLVQRAYAERREKERVEQNEILQAEYNQRRQQEAQLKETKEILDREWDSIQMPIRNHIAQLADERIESRWSRGTAVTKDNSPQFAADVLIYVRQEFYNEIAREDERATATGKTVKLDTPNEPPSRTLILENMKWLFDTKIRPITEIFQKELFLCNGCDGNFKFYGLESVVQHYAAKHTTTLSLGTQVVHWRAEWPEYPPFHPEPSLAKAAYYKIPAPQVSTSHAISGRDLEGLNLSTGPGPIPYAIAHKSYMYANQGHQPESQYPPMIQEYPHPINFTEHPQDSHHNPNFGVRYPGTQPPYNGASRIQNGFQASSSGQVSQIPQFQLSDRVNMEVSQAQGQATYGWHESDSAIHEKAITLVGTHQPNLPTRPLVFHPPRLESGRDYYGRAANLYQSQVEEMAKHARDVWSATSGIKDIPQSVRIFVVIQHVVARFKFAFTHEPSLTMFIDGLDNSPLMRPVRCLKGLACKVCVTSGNVPSIGQLTYAQLPLGDRKLYTLPQLLSHFRTVHWEPARLLTDSAVNPENPRPDWKFDMIELPETTLIADLINAQGLDDVKLQLITSAFPGLFPSSSMMGATGNAFRELSQPARSSEPPGEDEYDPHRPAYLGKIIHSGTSSAQAPKSTRISPMHENNPSTLRQYYYQHTQFPSGAMNRPQSPYTGSAHKVIANPNFTLNSQQAEYSDSLFPPRRKADSLPANRYVDELQDRDEEYTNGQLRGNNSVSYSHVSHASADRAIGESSVISKSNNQSLSPPHEGVSAADEFLDNLASGSKLARSRGLDSTDCEETRSIARRRDASLNRHPQTQSSTAIVTPIWRANSRNSDTRDSTLPAIPLHTVSARGSQCDKRTDLKESGGRISDRGYVANQSNISHIHPAAHGDRVERGSPGIYTEYGSYPKSDTRDQRLMSEVITKTSHVGGGAFQAQEASRYRSRSRSPLPPESSITYYHARSPFSQGQREPIYHIRSPSMRSDHRSQRIIGYDYPMQDRFEYVEDHRASDGQLRQRVEYVPIRLEESASMEPSRIVLAQPARMRAQSDYVRLDRDHGGEPVYERYDQLYHADPRSVNAQQSHGTPEFSRTYRF